jgi:hypothetical protein
MEEADYGVEHQEHVETQEDPTPLFTEERDINWKAHISDARCISWMQEISTDADVAIAATRFIPEVELTRNLATSGRPP